MDLFTLVKVYSSLLRKPTCFTRTLCKNVPPSTANLDRKIIASVLDDSISMNLLPTFGLHNLFFDTKEKEFHGTLIIKKIVKTYIRIRLYHAGKDYRVAFGISCRPGFSKLII